MKTKKNINESVAIDIALGIMTYKAITSVLGTITLFGVITLIQGGLKLYERNYKKCMESLKDFCKEFVNNLPSEQLNELKNKPLNDIRAIIKNALLAAKEDKVNKKVAKNAKMLLRFLNGPIVSREPGTIIDFNDAICEALGIR